jgi:hypothetical protein
MTELQNIAAGLSSTRGSGEPAQKRTKLKGYDGMPAQCLNPHGESQINSYPLDKVAAAMKTGNKAAASFSELCNEDKKRKGIEISRLSEIFDLAGQKLEKEPVYKKTLNEDAYKAAMTEYHDLAPHFKTLSGRDLPIDSDQCGETVGRIAYGANGPAAWRQPDKVNDAVAKVYEWLKKPQSSLRALTSALAGGGLFYVASVHEKCHRAWIAHGEETPISEELYASWAQARLCSSSDNANTPINHDLAALL